MILQDGTCFIKLSFLAEKNRILPFNIVMKNEQKYSETIEILDSYEKTLEDCSAIAGVDLNDKHFLIGDDQMTWERFPGAKCLRAHHSGQKASFGHLSPITFELFHMMMNYVQVAFDMLFLSQSACEVGMLKYLQERLSRKIVNGNVKNEYDAHESFMCDVTEIFYSLAIVKHFGMTSVFRKP